MQTMDFWFFWDIFRKRWKVILFCAFALATVAGVVSELFLTPIYRSSVTLYLGRVTESSPMEKAVAMSRGSGDILRSTAADLALGDTLSGDYRELINFDVITEGVEDQLAKQGKWQKKKYKVSTVRKGPSRILKINIDSDSPIYSQEVATIYAQEFINKVQQLVGIQNTQIIEEPALDMKPIFPIIPLNVALGFVAGFFLAFMCYVTARILDRRVRTSEEVESVLNVPVVGTVHKDKQYSLTKDNPFLFTSREESPQDRSQIAEDFRVFRVNLINKKPEDQKDGSVIAVTSTNAKEGKTFCTANLGAALAEAGYKVLLVDCDTGERGLQSYFGKADEKGLMNILSGEANFEDTVKRNLNNLNMDVLFCGDKSLNSANLMVSPKFKELMSKLKQDYDYAFLDVSCHLGTADIVSAGSSADSVLLLVRAGKTEGNVIKQTADALKRANLDISGVILNGVDEE